MIRHVPVILGVLALIGFSVAEARMSGRFQGSNMTEEQFAALLEECAGEHRRLARQRFAGRGAGQKDGRGTRLRFARRTRTRLLGESVTIWLIVGHSKDVVRHTPDVCYPSSGFTTRAPENSLQPFVFDGKSHGRLLHEHVCQRGRNGAATGARLLVVVQAEGRTASSTWKAPKIVRWEFGNARSLYQAVFHQQHARLSAKRPTKARA